MESHYLNAEKTLYLVDLFIFHCIEIYLFLFISTSVLIFRRASFFCSASSDHYNSDLSCYFHELESPLFLQCSKCKFNSDAQEFPLCRIVPSGRFPEHFNPDLFRSWGSIIAYPHNLHFLQTPPLISHTLSFITISIVNLYL